MRAGGHLPDLVMPRIALVDDVVLIGGMYALDTYMYICFKLGLLRLLRVIMITMSRVALERNVVPFAGLP